MAVMSVSMMIQLTQGKFARVDFEDYEELSRHEWYAAKAKGTYHAMRCVWNPVTHERHTIRMHREIMNAPAHLQVDHRRHDGLDNRRSNLRLCTSQQNSQNRQKKSNCSSKYKGVCWYKKPRKWRVKIGFNGKRVHLGYFEDEIEAADAYNAKAIELFGAFAHLNDTKREENYVG